MLGFFGFIGVCPWLLLVFFCAGHEAGFGDRGWVRRTRHRSLTFAALLGACRKHLVVCR
jgi:hypothetical protein